MAFKFLIYLDGIGESKLTLKFGCLTKSFYLASLYVLHAYVNAVCAQG